MVFDNKMCMIAEEQIGSKIEAGSPGQTVGAVIRTAGMR